MGSRFTMKIDYNVGGGKGIGTKYNITDTIMEKLMLTSECGLG